MNDHQYLLIKTLVLIHISLKCTRSNLALMSYTFISALFSSKYLRQQDVLGELWVDRTMWMGWRPWESVLSRHPSPDSTRCWIVANWPYRQAKWSTVRPWNTNSTLLDLEFLYMLLLHLKHITAVCYWYLRNKKSRLQDRSLTKSKTFEHIIGY